MKILQLPKVTTNLKKEKWNFFPTNRNEDEYFFRYLLRIFPIKSMVIRAFRLYAISDDHAKPQFRIMMRK